MGEQMEKEKCLQYKIQLLEKTPTDLQEGSEWIYYLAENLQNGKILKSYILANEDDTEEKIVLEISRKIDSLVDLGSLSTYLQTLILKCHYSENEMWFVEDHDEFFIKKMLETKGKFEEDLEEEICRNDLSQYFEFGFDPTITVFGGISEAINFKLSEGGEL